MALTNHHSITPGAELPPISKPISQRRIDCYSGVRPKSIHTDPEWAKKKGFAAPLAQGMMSTAYVSEMMVRLLGEGFIRGGRMSVKFVKPVLAGDTLTMHGRVKSKELEGEATRVVVELWCENQDGVTTMVGEASGLAAR
ncbi:MAG: MaoC family dehydratase [Burkholderiales bacterium]|nr:MaoC family dehydratase [Burkholderiales bacterium]